MYIFSHNKKRILHNYIVYLLTMVNCILYNQCTFNYCYLIASIDGVIKAFPHISSEENFFSLAITMNSIV